VVERRDDLPGGAGDVGFPAGGVGDGRDVELDLGQAAAVPGDRHLPAGQADVRPDHDEPVPAGMAVGPEVRRPQRVPWVQPGQRPHERRPAAVQEGPASRLRLLQPEDDDLQVGVLHGVHDHERAVGDAGEELGHPRRPAQADVVEGDARDVARRDRAAALLGDEVA